MTVVNEGSLKKMYEVEIVHYGSVEICSCEFNSLEEVVEFLDAWRDLEQELTHVNIIRKGE